MPRTCRLIKGRHHAARFGIVHFRYAFRAISVRVKTSTPPQRSNIRCAFKKNGLNKGKKCLSSYRFCIFYKHHCRSSSCYPETMRFPRFASSDRSDLQGVGDPFSWFQLKFIQACGSHCTHLVHLHQSWANLHHNPAAKG